MSSASACGPQCSQNPNQMRDAQHRPITTPDNQRLQRSTHQFARANENGLISSAVRPSGSHSAQPFQTRVLALFTKLSLEEPYSTEMPGARTVRLRLRVPGRPRRRHAAAIAGGQP